jgi:hypothetical protein
MSNDEARRILDAFRRGGRDADDPVFAKALEMARRNPELGAWLMQTQVEDALLAEKLREGIAVPGGLREELLELRSVVPLLPWWRRMPWGWVAPAIAAGLVLLITLGALWLRAPAGPAFAQYRLAIARMLTSEPPALDMRTNNLEQIRAWSAQQGGPAEFRLPSGLTEGQALGCRVVDWEGRKVTLVCFELATGRMAHLLVVDGADFGGTPGTSPQFLEIAGIGTISWTTEDRTYLLASDGATRPELLALLYRVRLEPGEILRQVKAVKAVAR